MPINVAETAASCCCGVRMYDSNADNFQRPRVFMRESLKPILAAVVAAPMRKLCPLKQESSTPAACRACRRKCTSLGLERVQPSSNRNSGPGVRGRIARYPSINVTGHKTSPVIPKCRIVPTAKGSFFAPL